MSRQCPSCHASVSDTAKFCRECGTKIVVEKFIFCEECGTKCKSTDRFCEECGFDLLGNSAPQMINNIPETSFFTDSIFKPSSDIDLTLFEPVVLKGNSKYSEAVKHYRTFNVGTIDDKIEKIENALKHLENANDAKAIWFIGKAKALCYNEVVTMPYYEKAFNLGFADAEVDYLIDLTWDDEDYALTRLKELADEGNISALNFYASHLLNIDEDLDVIKEYFLRAANMGDPDSISQMIDWNSYDDNPYYDIEWIKKLFELRPSTDPDDPCGTEYDLSLACALGDVADMIERGKIPELDISVAAVARQRCYALFDCQDYCEKFEKVKYNLPRY